MTQAESQTIDLLNAISDQPVTATWNGAGIVGMRGANSFPEELMPGGFLKDYAFTFLTTLKIFNGQIFEDRFSTLPANGDEFTFDGTLFSIARVVLDDLGVGIQLDFENANK